MGIAITALSDAYRLVQHNPVVLWLGWVATVAIGVANLVLGFIPLVGNLLSLLLGPVFLAGMLALIYSGRDGTASPSEFLEGVKSHYLSLLGSSFLLGLLLTVIGVGGFVAMAFFMPMGSSVNGGLGAGAATAAILLPVAVIGISVVVLGMLFQFFDVAIVVDGESAISAFNRSIAVFTTAPLSALGYTVLRGVLGGLFFFVPLALIATMASSLLSVAAMGSAGGDILGAAGITVIGGLALWLLVLLPLGQVVLLTYHVAFYNRFTATAG